MMISARTCAMVGGMHRSMLDGELALIARRARRLLARTFKKTQQLRRQKSKLVVLADDAVWPQLHGYPYGKVA
jgi:hypothetical protein